MIGVIYTKNNNHYHPPRWRIFSEERRSSRRQRLVLNDDVGGLEWALRPPACTLRRQKRPCRSPFGTRTAVNCICQNGPQRPGMQEVLNSLERHTVCTGTQCFEGEEDAFGITTAPNGAPTNNTTFFMFMMCAPPALLWPQLSLGSDVRTRCLTAHGDDRSGSQSCDCSGAQSCACLPAPPPSPLPYTHTWEGPLVPLGELGASR